MSLSGCSDLFEKKVVKRTLESSRFAASCQLNVDGFSKILHESISSDIICLKENLHLFLRLVKSDLPDNLSLVAFEAFIRNNRKDISPEVVQAIKSVFEINHLITGEDPLYISRASVDRLLDFAMVFNKEAAKNYAPIFESESSVTFAVHLNHRDRVSSSVKVMIGALRRIFNSNRGTKIHKINLVNLIDNFTTESNKEDMANVKKVLFAKGVFLGGENEVLTHVELDKLIYNVEYLTLIALDIIRYENVVLNQESLLQLLKRDVTDLQEIIFEGPLNDRDTIELFTMDQVIDVIKTYVPKSDFDVDKFKSMIIEGKRVAMGGDPKKVRGIEIKKLFSHANTLLKTGNVFHRIYAKFKAQLDSAGPVDVNFSEHRHTFPEHQKEYQQFERIVKKYRFYKGEFLSAYYSQDHRRNPDAVFEIALWEYALQMIMKEYGSPSSALGGYSINQAQVRALIDKFIDELIDLELFLPGMAHMNADNISLLGTLFQSQSDNNGMLDSNEASEFAISLVTSLNTSKEMMKYFSDSAGCKVDEFKRVSATCFKDHFMKGVCKLYRPYYPRLFEAYNTPEKCEDIDSKGPSMPYVQASINAARACNFYPDGQKEEVPFSEGDVLTIMMVLMHIETTVNRWDKNQNNFMDVAEVETAYSIYSSALDGFLADKNPIIKKFKKQIYQYMIRYETIPDEKDFGSIMKFVRFLLRFNKRSTGDRKTIANILYQIGEQNKKMPGAIPFDCAGMRNPPGIPRNGTFLPRSSNMTKAEGTDFIYLLEQYVPQE